DYEAVLQCFELRAQPQVERAPGHLDFAPRSDCAAFDSSGPQQASLEPEARKGRDATRESQRQRAAVKPTYAQDEQGPTGRGLDPLGGRVRCGEAQLPANGARSS